METVNCVQEEEGADPVVEAVAGVAARLEIFGFGDQFRSSGSLAVMMDQSSLTRDFS
jgi:hypothetical protein